MQHGDDLYLFLEEEAVRVISHNKDWSWHDNWDIVELLPMDEWPERDDRYKAIGETIREVWTDGYDTDDTRIDADMKKWIDAVGEGGWGAKEGEQYTFIKLKTAMKIIAFGTVYWDCHYPDTVWEVIEDPFENSSDEIETEDGDME